MDLTTLRTEVRDILGETTADFWSDAELNRHINEGLRRFASAHRWSFMLTEGTVSVTANTPTFTLPASITDVRTMNLLVTNAGSTRPYLLKRVSGARGFQHRQTNYTATSYVSYFYVTSTAETTGTPTTTIRLIPTPSGNISIAYQYYREPAVLTNGTDVPDLPLKYHKAVVHYAAATAWLKELTGNAKHQEQMALYYAIVDEARSDEEAQADGDFLIVGSEDDSDSGNIFTAEDYALRRISDTLGP